MRTRTRNGLLAVALVPTLVACGSGSSETDTESAQAEIGSIFNPGYTEETDKAALLEFPEEQELAFYAIDTNNMTQLEQEMHSRALNSIDAAKQGDFDASTHILDTIEPTGQIKLQEIRDVIDWVAWERARDVVMDYGELAVSYAGLIDSQGQIVDTVARDDIERGLAGRAIDFAQDGLYGESTSRLAMIDDIGAVTKTNATDDAEEYIANNARGLAGEGFFAEAIEAVDYIDSNGKLIGVVLRDEIENAVAQEVLRQYESGNEGRGQVLVEIIDDVGQVTRSRVLASVAD